MMASTRFSSEIRPRQTNPLSRSAKGTAGKSFSTGGYSVRDSTPNLSCKSLADQSEFARFRLRFQPPRSAPLMTPQVVK